VAPSTELRRWYAHRAEVFAEFAQRYRQELDRQEGRGALARLHELAGDRPLILLTATPRRRAQPAVLAEVLTESS
jgi:uncharacterized protein YeaO (DUF488 family)